MIDSDEQTESRLTEIRHLIGNHARAKRTRTHLEQFRKVKKSLLMKAAEMQGVKTAALQERDAYADPEYQQLIVDLADACGQETETWWLLQLEEWKFETWRTRMANARAEKNRYGA